MSGYREHSFDPNAYEQPGPVLRPYNWVQWTGIVLGTVGFALFVLGVAAKFGWISEEFDLGFGPVGLLLAGSALVNSRRGPGTPFDEQQLRRNRRTLVITVFACAVILAAALVIEFQGA